MKATYDFAQDAIEIDLSELDVGFLKAYTLSVLAKMQIADSELSDCWTACVIGIEDGSLCPTFVWGSIEDLHGTEEPNEIYVALPEEEE